MTRARRMLYLTCLQKQYIPKTRKYVKVEPADFLTRLYDSPLCFCTGSCCCCCCCLAWQSLAAAGPKMLVLVKCAWVGAGLVEHSP